MLGSGPLCGCSVPFLGSFTALGQQHFGHRLSQHDPTRFQARTASSGHVPLSLPSSLQGITHHKNHPKCFCFLKHQNAAQSAFVPVQTDFSDFLGRSLFSAPELYEGLQNVLSIGNQQWNKLILINA